MRPIGTNLERLELICQRLRGRPLSQEELQVEVEKALDAILQVLKSHKRLIDDVELNKRRFFP